MKPHVSYVGEAYPVGNCAILRPLNHRNLVPGQCVINFKEAITSAVISWSESGRIETLNTIYLPVLLDDEAEELHTAAELNLNKEETHEANTCV